MSDYDKANFKKFYPKKGSAIDEDLFERVTAILNCQDKNSNMTNIYSQDDKEVSKINPKKDLLIYEHMNGNGSGSSSSSLSLLLLLSLLMLVMMYLNRPF